MASYPRGDYYWWPTGRLTSAWFDNNYGDRRSHHSLIERWWRLMRRAGLVRIRARGES